MGISKYFLFFIVIFPLIVSCSKKQELPNSKEGYVGNWKLTDPQGNTYYMSLNADGSCKTTREGGEIGTWDFKQDHIEAQWIPKTIRLYYDPGQTKARLTPTVTEERSGSSIGTKVEKVPE